MGIYLAYMFSPIIVYAVITFLYKKPIGESDSMRHKYLIICGVIIFMMLACRDHTVGSSDATWYFNNWVYLSQVPANEFWDVSSRFDMERGYLFSVWLLSHIFNNPQFLFILYGLLVAVSIIRFLYLNCENVVLGVVMFNCLGLWGFMAQGIRQGIAMCICLFALEYCKQRKFIKFILHIALAMLFHASAIAFIVVYFLPRLKMDVKGYFVVGIGAFICALCLDDLFGLFNLVMNDAYTTNDIYSTSGGFVSTLIYCLIIFATLLTYGRKKDNELDERMFFYMLCCGFLLFVMRYSVNTIAQRVAYYYMFSQIPMLSMVLQKFNNRDRAISTIIVVCLCLGITIYKASYSVLVPYVLFWQV